VLLVIRSDAVFSFLFHLFLSAVAVEGANVCTSGDTEHDVMRNRRTAESWGNT